MTDLSKTLARWGGRVLPVLVIAHLWFFAWEDAGDGPADSILFFILLAAVVAVAAVELRSLFLLTRERLAVDFASGALPGAAFGFYLLLTAATVLFGFIGFLDPGAFGFGEEYQAPIMIFLILFVIKQVIFEAYYFAERVYSKLGREERQQLHQLNQIGVGAPHAFLKDLPTKRVYSVMSLERRSLRLKRRANLIMLLIVVLIGGGIFISIFVAGDVVTSESSPVNRLSDVRSLIDDYEDELLDVNAEIADATARRQQAIVALLALGVELSEGVVAEGDAPTVATDPDKVSIFDLSSECTATNENGEQVIVRCAEIVEVSDAVVEVERLSRRIEQLEEVSNRRSQTVAMIEEEMVQEFNNYLPQEATAETSVELLVASGVTRFGILFVVIYLVQILVGIYRYSQRLAAHYDMLADALISNPESSNGLGKWKADLSPAVDFGKVPVSPSQHVLDIVRAFLARREKKTAPEQETS